MGQVHVNLGVSFNGAATNWSRKSVPGSWRTRSDGGFNGAATNWSRKSQDCRCVCACRNELQWGRDQLVAEITKQKAKRKQSFCFNGAATNWSRKSSRKREAASWPASFNGAATNWSRKCGGSWTPQIEVRGFNGAATNWSRKSRRTCTPAG
mgnify:CR=1 FL=1